MQEDGTAGDDSEEEGSAEARSESLDSEDADGDSEDGEAASRRLNVRTGEPLLTASVGALCMLPCCSAPEFVTSGTVVTHAWTAAMIRALAHCCGRGPG